MAPKTDPEILYKYRDWSNCYHRKIVTHNELFFPSTRDLNDPFEAVIPIRYDHGTDEQWLEVYKRQVRNEFPRYNQEFVTKEACERMGARTHEGPRAVEAYQNNAIEYMRNNFGAFSLSTCRDSILMWSHYARGHKGFCIGLNVKYLKESFEHVPNDAGNVLALYPVEYCVCFPFLDGFDSDYEKRIPRIITTKSKDWQYEEEWRLLLIKGKPSLNGPPRVFERAIRFEGELIKEVIFGIEIPNSDRDEIVKILGKQLPRVKVFQAHKKRDSFGITVEPFKP